MSYLGSACGQAQASVWDQDWGSVCGQSGFSLWLTPGLSLGLGSEHAPELNAGSARKQY